MLFIVDPQSDVPVYRQLMEQVRFSIASGQLQPGDELPSTRALSAELGVNPMTVSKAYSYLERDGVLERRPGRPLVVRPFDGAQLQTRRVDLVRENLRPVVALVRQLGLGEDEALRVFGELMAEAESKEELP
jgi:GntR family transcriptional regulator